MDSRNAFIMVICSAIISTVYSQLTSNDINFMKKTIMSFQDETNGIFDKSLDTTFKSIYSLKMLNQEIPLRSRICKEISFEAMNGYSVEMLKINNLLNCQITFENIIQLSAEKMMNTDFETLNNRFDSAKILGEKINYELLFENLKGFVTDKNLFSNVNGSNKGLLMITTRGIKMLTEIHKNMEGEIKDEVGKMIVLMFTNIQNDFQLISEVIK